MESLRILVAEDHPLFRKGMISLLSSVADFEVVGEAASVFMALRQGRGGIAGR